MKMYLGDAVYADFDGNGIILTTQNGLPEPTNTIYMEQEVVVAFLAYVERVKKEIREEAEN